MKIILFLFRWEDCKAFQFSKHEDNEIAVSIEITGWRKVREVYDDRACYVFGNSVII